MADPTPVTPAASGTPAAPAAAAPAAPAGGDNPLLAAAAALGTAAAPASGTAAPASDPAKPAADPAKPAAPYFPEGLPEALRGKDERETLDKMWAAEQARKPPEKPADYKLEVTKDLEGIVDPANDRVLPIWREVAHKHGLSQAQFQAVVGDLFVGMEKAGLVERGVNVKAEFEALGAGAGDKQAQMQRGIQVVQEVVDKIKGIGTRNGLSEAEVGAVVRALDNRTSVVAMQKILALIPAELGVRPGGQGGDAPASDPEALLRKMYPSMQPNGQVR